MRLLKLRILVLIDRLHQVTAVAQALQMKQPTISVHMKKMEQEWGVKLFAARPGRIVLTEAGRALLPYAASIVALYEEAEEKVVALRDSGRQRVAIGLTDAAAVWLAGSDWLQRCAPEEALLLAVESGAEEELLPAQQQGRLDLIVYGVAPAESATAEAQHRLRLVESPLTLAVPADQPLAAAPPAAAAELAGLAVVRYGAPSVARIVRDWEGQLSEPLAVRASFATLELTLQAALQLGCAAIVPEALLGEGDARFGRLPLPDCTQRWRLEAAWRAAPGTGEQLARIASWMA
ncbi:LysR family transcriptional regulator [Paenibacillus sp. IB182496]|uniref:LysR family transcriptional regulator n=1 Tax=Paenibacillus sabuli TaxID=2772509 RepID=A0A927GS93_9BACL|nr:LysR family transcriptional regulator [Paenibacillus sabuli]MBD2846494.1 LysR family transcriptional regulator [Paenibacillus sabuli]